MTFNIFLSNFGRNFYTKTNNKLPLKNKILKDGSLLIYKENNYFKKEISEELLPPRIRPLNGLKDDLTRQEIKEAFSLRKSDPIKWTISNLSKRFKTDPDIIHLRIPTPKEHMKVIHQKENEKFDLMTWTKKKRIIDRIRRRALW